MQGRCFKYIFIFFVNTMISCCTKTTFNQLLKKLIQNDIIYAVYIRTLVGTPFWAGFLAVAFCCPIGCPNFVTIYADKK